MANYKITKALIGYAIISAYAALSTLSTTINLLCAVGYWVILDKNRCKNQTDCLFLA